MRAAHRAMERGTSRIQGSSRGTSGRIGTECASPEVLIISFGAEDWFIKRLALYGTDESLGARIQEMSVSRFTIFLGVRL